MLTSWSNFYVVTGSAAAGLTGLMFIVITLVTGLGRPQRSSDGVATFSTPTVVHFTMAFVFSATLCAPWHSLRVLGTVIAVAALPCVVYVAAVAVRTRRLSRYRADFEDWCWYALIPALAYCAVVVSGAGLALGATAGLVGLAAGVASLIVIGIRNAWDTVTYIAVGNAGEDEG